MKYIEPPQPTKQTDIFSVLGSKIINSMIAMGSALVLLIESICYIPLFYTRKNEIVRQLYICGIKSFGVTSIMALFTGMIICLQSGAILKNYGTAHEVGNLVANIMYRELGPMMTGLIIAASVGAGIAAELSTMQVSEEVDALHVININPARFLVMPRLIALIIMLPVLTIFANLIGTLGGMIIATTQFSVSPQLYMQRATVFLSNHHMFVGLFKSMFFSLIITSVSCYQGFAARNGANGVGQATRNTVVYSFLLILIMGYFITALFQVN